MNESSNDKYLSERVAVLENESENHDKRIEKVEDITDTLRDMKGIMDANAKIQERLTISMERMEQRQEKFDERLDSFDKTLNNVNGNISLLNQSQINLQHEMTAIKEDINTTNNELAEVKKKAEENENKGKFDVTEFLSKELPKAIGLALLGAVLVYIGWVK